MGSAFAAHTQLQPSIMPETDNLVPNTTPEASRMRTRTILATITGGLLVALGTFAVVNTPTEYTPGTQMASGCPFGADSSAPCAVLFASLASLPKLSPQDPPGPTTGYMTARGCKCTSECGTSVADNYGRCDWCYTEGSCGDTFSGDLFGLRGHWDYCKYAPYAEPFHSQAHNTKQSQLWERLTAPNVVGKSAPAKSAAQVLSQILGESMITTFDDEWEVMPKGRTKVIHTQGVACQFDLDVSSTQYTGLFAKGKQAGIIRMGAAANLDSWIGRAFFPGMGIKFLRSGVRPGSFVALRATGAGGSENFFASTISNHVAPAAALVKLNKFQQASGCIDMVGLSDVCAYTQDGKTVASPNFPFELYFEPTAAAKATQNDEKKTNDSLLKALASIKPGTTLFDVYAFASPADKKAGKKALLGSLSTTSQCVQTLFGDEHFYFRHQRMEQDFALRPEWIKQMPELKDSACKATAGPIGQWQCPAKK